MAKAECNEVDINIDVENVSFLDNCFDNSFTLQCSINYVRNNVEEIIEINKSKKKIVSQKSDRDSISKRRSFLSQSNGELSQIHENTQTFKKKLCNWGLPGDIAAKYEQKGIIEMFEWQVQCLGNSKILLDSCNLVYSAPTSAGKTLVAEILSIKTILERQKKVIIILPFVSIVREKMFYLQEILGSSGIRVEGFMGSQSPPGGLQAVHLAICTIEKANSLINKLIDDGKISDLGAVIVDELHLLGDPHRGYILELLLTKIKYLSSKVEDINIQIVGMSATLPNLTILSNWLEAELYVTDFRPIPLDEYCLVGNKYYDKAGNFVNILYPPKENIVTGDHVLYICLETIKENCSVLIFCMTKNRCESLAQSIATSFYKLGCSKSSSGLVLRDQLNTEKIAEVLEQLQNCPVGLDQLLKNIVSFGVAYHHAGLTFDERDIIEGAFKSGAIRVLIATSTLSSGVNLPARKVIIRSPVFQKQPINILTYKQMVGRAGRMGKDAKGESILICTEAEQKVGFDLMMGNLDPVKSCINSEDKFMRAVLEMIASEAVSTKCELELYCKCTLLHAQQQSISEETLLEKTLDQLINFELVRIQKDDDKTNYVATSLGKACLASSMAPNDGISLFCELQKARQCMVLENDLHLIYLVTPYSVSNQWNNIDWLHLLTLWESLTAAMKRVGELVGVQESFIIRSLRGINQKNSLTKLNIHKRFYTALALQDLVNEKPLSEVAQKFQCARGFLQGLQQSAATFAGMVTAFCHQLGWKNMEMLVSQFQDRLHFGIHSDLLELMKLSTLNGTRARTLFDAGFETIASIASANANDIENTLHKAAPFQSDKELENDDDADVRKRKKMKNIWITGCCGMTAREAAERLILEARKYLQLEIGVTDIKWENKEGRSCIEIENQSKVRESSPLQQTNCDKDSQNNNKDELQCIDTKTVTEICTEENENKCNELVHIITPETKTMPLNELESSQEPEILTSQNDFNNIECTVRNKNNNSIRKCCNGNASSNKDDVVWDSLFLSDTVLRNITTGRSTLAVPSPNISFDESEPISSANSAKDISLFSSDDNNSSLFEDSINIDLMCDNANQSKEEILNMLDQDIANETINSNTILNAFKSTIIDIDEDEDIKLVYEDENKISEVNIASIGTISSNEKSISNRRINEISSLKRNANADRIFETPNKKIRQQDCENYNVILKCSQSKKNIVRVAGNEIKCYVLKEEDIINNLRMIEKNKEVAVILDVNFKQNSQSNVIGQMICNNNKSSLNRDDPYPNNEVVKSLSFCLSRDECYYCDLSSIVKSLPAIKLRLKRIFNDKTYIVKLVSTKSYAAHIKRWLNVELSCRCSDISVVDWLLDSGENLYNVIELTKKFCDIDVSKVDIIVNDKTCKYDNLDEITRSCLKAWCVFSVNEKQKKFMEKYDFLERISDIETHIAKILGRCEYYGVAVDKQLASQLLVDVKNSQETLQKKAFKLCGYHFNFNSSKDVAKVLGIYNGRKISTKKSVLTAHNSPMASIVIYWRKLNSILTKTLYPLTEQASIYSSENRISPTYATYTSTGRISMHEPNLQNVPRTFAVPIKYLTSNEIEPCDDVIEFNCRNIFKAAPGCTFVSADYCQLEMRILTHYSEDVVLTKIMGSDVDVFRSIAASWSGVPEDQVDDDLRQKAKQLCYGILYGMGNRTLAQQLDVSETEAAVFMDAFYTTYPAIRTFTSCVVDDCRRHGYVETLMKRRRYLPDINSAVAAKRSAAERQAVNTTIQGSAADIAKAAMCAIDSRTSGPDQPRLILQMHDELIYEVPETNKYTFPLVLKEVMENTVQLSVPLPVKVRTGSTWGCLEEMKF